jgi:hypothetical protein
MIANAKIEVILVEGEKETRLKSIPGRQVKKNGPVAAGDVKRLMPDDLFDTAVYQKLKDEVWGSSGRAPLDDADMVHWMPNLTYTVYVEKK